MKNYITLLLLGVTFGSGQKSALRLMEDSETEQTTESDSDNCLEEIEDSASYAVSNAGCFAGPHAAFFGGQQQAQCSGAKGNYGGCGVSGAAGQYCGHGAPGLFGGPGTAGVVGHTGEMVLFAQLVSAAEILIKMDVD